MAWVYTYTDCAGNPHDWTFTYTIDIPDFTPAADEDTTVNCLVDAQVPPTPPAVNDFCGNPITPILTTTPTAIPCEGDHGLGFHLYRLCRQSHDWTYTYTIDIPDFTPAADETPPSTVCRCAGSAHPARRQRLLRKPDYPDPHHHPIGHPPVKETMAWVFTYTDCAGNHHMDLHLYHRHSGLYPGR